MKITNMEFTDSEWEEILSLAARRKDYKPGLTPQNVIRLALRLSARKRGGARPNAGRPKETKETK